MKWTSLPLGPIQTNCYLVWDETARKGAVIDPGDEPDRLLEAIRKTGMEPSAVLLTHGHHDHTGAVKALKAAYPRIPVYLHDGDLPYGKDPHAFMPDVEERTASYGEGDVISVGDLSFEVLHTPGHTPGGVTLKLGNILFTGDTLFAGSMGRTDFPGGNEGEIFRSLRRLAELPGDYTVCPGHERTTTLERERKGNHYMRLAAQSGR